MLAFFRNLIRPNHPIRQFYSTVRGWIAAFVYRFPAKKLLVIGVTGTDGKTSTVHFTTDLLFHAGKKVGMISSVSLRKGERIMKNTTKRTSLDPFMTQKFLRELVREEYEMVVLEVSSHALAQGRLAGIPFDIAVVVNISPEHLDYHNTMEEYAAAKRKLLENIIQFFPKPQIEKHIIINASLPFLETFQSVAPVLTRTFSTTTDAVFQAKQIQSTQHGVRFWLMHGEEKREVFIPVAGEYNVENALAAVSVASSVHIPLLEIKEGLQSLSSVPGRMEEIKEGQSFRLFVDFALTPGAMEALLRTARSMTSEKVCIVFGFAGGDHDRDKRPVIGKICGKLADISFITEDENYGESFESILQGIEEGMKQTSGNFSVIQDRRQAIATACQKADPGDIVIVTGMGMLGTRDMGGEVIPWDDRVVCRDEVRKLQSSSR